jgi:hypothetical protein
MFSNLFSITLPNIGKYFPGIYFLKENYFPANKWESKLLWRENPEVLKENTPIYIILLDIKR